MFSLYQLPHINIYLYFFGYRFFCPNGNAGRRSGAQARGGSDARPDPECSAYPSLTPPITKSWKETEKVSALTYRVRIGFRVFGRGVNKVSSGCKRCKMRCFQCTTLERRISAWVTAIQIVTRLCCRHAWACRERGRSSPCKR